ncbi:MAG TPA: hypothetical protein VD993_11545 [Chitinophagaceae bacterium]|nr:hypothetical protein [Chitinophagaceae bacterium]
MQQQSAFRLFLLALLAACGQSPAPHVTTNQSNNNQPSSTPQRKAEVMKFVKHEVIDRQGTGMVACTYLIPEGWTAQDQLYWEYNDATVPIRYKGIFKSRDGSMMIQSYPDVRSVWATGPAGSSGYPPPSGLIAGLREVVKAERKGLSFRVAEEKLVSNTPPQTNYQQGSAVTSSSQAGFIRIEFQENGREYEEEFYGQLDVADMRTPSVMGEMRSLIWGGTSLYSCRAPKGKLEECRKIALTAKTSARLTLPFYNRLAQVIQLLSDQVYQRIYQAGHISRIISQTNDQMISNIRSSYQQSQQANDRIYNQFSDYMRGVDRYSDGQSQVQLPSGYTNAWVNDRGEYLLSNTQGYDPNRDMNGNWKALQRN